MTIAKGYAVKDSNAKFEVLEFERREVGAHDVEIEILWSGICHTDIHQARNELHMSNYPLIPGHEIVGRVTKAGSKVTKLHVGDFAGVGCMVDSCEECKNCHKYFEQYCDEGSTWTYGSLERGKQTFTYGGYSNLIVVKDKFVFAISKKFQNLATVSPLLCAGVTVYSPIKKYLHLVKEKVGIVGLGGLGHLAVKIAVAFGAEVTVFSTSANKEKDARNLGAAHFVISKDVDAMKKEASKYDFILDTISAVHETDPYLEALNPGNGVLCIVGLQAAKTSFSSPTLVLGGRTVSGSLIGGTAETQEMLDFCAEKNILSEIEIITADRIEEAFDRTIKADVKYRFVIDIKSSKF